MPRSAEGRHVGVPAVRRWPAHVDDDRARIACPGRVDDGAGPVAAVIVAADQHELPVAVGQRVAVAEHHDRGTRSSRAPWRRPDGDVGDGVELNQRAAFEQGRRAGRHVEGRDRAVEIESGLGIGLRRRQHARARGSQRSHP